MPIKGLSDRGLAFPEIGQIRKGAKKGENRPGADLKYFRVEFDENETKTAELFKTIYKDQYDKLGGPQFIRIIFPFNEIERMWDPWYEAYTAGRMVARSDGEYITYQLDDQGEIVVHNGVDLNGNKVPHPADNTAGKDYRGNPVKFKATGRLKIIVPELSRAAYLTVMTTSKNDIANISDQLAAFRQLNGGVLAGIPFILRRRPKMVSQPKSDTDKTRVRRVKWLISIEADPKWANAKLGQVKSLAMPDFDESLLLPSGDVQIEDGDVEIDEDEISDFETEPVDGEVQAIELIDPMGQWAVAYAMKEWNISQAETCKAIASKNLGKRIDKNEFMQIVTA